MNRSRLTRPPATLGKAKLDNLVLVPGSLLPFKEEWQALANQLPAGATLIVLPVSDGAARATLQKVSRSLQAKGRTVATMPARRFGSSHR
jgi:hypothetical protein